MTMEETAGGFKLGRKLSTKCRQMLGFSPENSPTSSLSEMGHKMKVKSETVTAMTCFRITAPLDTSGPSGLRLLDLPPVHNTSIPKDLPPPPLPPTFSIPRKAVPSKPAEAAPKKESPPRLTLQTSFPEESKLENSNPPQLQRSQSLGANQPQTSQGAFPTRKSSLAYKTRPAKIQEELSRRPSRRGKDPPFALSPTGSVRYPNPARSNSLRQQLHQISSPQGSFSSWDSRNTTLNSPSTTISEVDTELTSPSFSIAEKPEELEELPPPPPPKPLKYKPLKAVQPPMLSRANSSNYQGRVKSNGSLVYKKGVTPITRQQACNVFARNAGGYQGIRADLMTPHPLSSEFDAAFEYHNKQKISLLTPPPRPVGIQVGQLVLNPVYFGSKTSGGIPPPWLRNFKSSCFNDMLFEHELIQHLEPVISEHGCIVSYLMFPDATPEVEVMYSQGHFEDLLRNPEKIVKKDWRSYLVVHCGKEEKEEVERAVTKWFNWFGDGEIKIAIEEFR